MRESEKSPIVLIASQQQHLLEKLRDALADTDFALLYAQTTDEALALLERLKSEIDLAIVELELPELGGWDLIGQLTKYSQKPVKIIATTSVYSERLFGRVLELGVDAVVPIAISSEAWHKSIEAVLLKNENRSATAVAH